MHDPYRIIALRRPPPPNSLPSHPPQFVRRLLFQLVGMIRLQLLADLDVPCAKWSTTATTAPAAASAAAAAGGTAGGGTASKEAGAAAVPACTARYPWWLLQQDVQLGSNRGGVGAAAGGGNVAGRPAAAALGPTSLSVDGEPRLSGMNVVCACFLLGCLWR